MEKLKLSESEKKSLLIKARREIEKKLGMPPGGPDADLSAPIFESRYGMFVTLTIDGELRGCIGTIEGTRSLRQSVSEMAVQSAFHDPRFYPLNAEEFKGVSIEISILYPLERVTDVNDIQVGRDGLVMEREYHRGLLLPQVATEWGWDRETFLNQTCRKAGMEAFCWENGAAVYKFEAEVFNEPGLSLR